MACDLNALIAQARCLQCSFTGEMYAAAEIVLLCALRDGAPMSCDPQTLMSQAQCILSCIPLGMLPAVKAALLCDIANIEPVVPPAVSNPSLDSLVAYWKADEAGAVNRLDSSGNSHTLTVTGAVNSATGKINNGASNFAAARFLSCADAVFSGAFPFTAFCWVTSGFLGFSQSILGKYSPGILTGWEIRQTGADRFSLHSGNFADTDLSHTTPVTVGPFFLVIVSFTGSGAGSIRVNNGADVAGAVNNPGNSGTNFIVGGNSNGGEWNGVIDEIGIYNRLLTSAEKDALWNAGAGKQYPFT